jgi:hypothetical protein
MCLNGQHTSLVAVVSFVCWLQEVFARQLRSLDPFRELTDDDVRTAIKNSSGVAG